MEMQSVTATGSLKFPGQQANTARGDPNPAETNVTHKMIHEMAHKMTR